MNFNDISYLIIPQNYGKFCDNFQTKTYSSKAEAKYFFVEMKKSLLNVNDWNNFKPKLLSKFYLFDFKGYLKNGLANTNDLIKIKLGRMFNLFNDGGDWVKVVSIHEGSIKDIQYIQMILQPTHQPKNSDSAVAHFLDSHSTNTIIVSLKENCIQVSIHGRNELVNKFQSHSFIKKLRNQIIASIGFSGLNKLQWQGLCDGLINKDYGK